MASIDNERNIEPVKFIFVLFGFLFWFRISFVFLISFFLHQLYRHPADEAPQTVEWTPMAAKLRDLCSEKLNQPINHALIQWYRSGKDFISEHADKTIDVAKDSVIVNLSVGATRVMMLKTKNRTEEKRKIERIDLVCDFF